MQTINLSGRHTVITGGAGGIGLAIAQHYLRAGASVALWDQDSDLLTSAAQALSSLGAVQTCVVDVREELQVEKAAQVSFERYGAVDILVNNAGILGPLAPAWAYTPAQWRKVLDINLTGAYLCSRAVIPTMLSTNATRPRRIINIASTAGKEGNAFNAAYSASKAGLIALTKSLGKELASASILVNCITPSAADTAIFNNVPPEHQAPMREALLARVPMGRFAHVDEIAEMASWLASDACSFSTGAVFDISGGRSMY